MGVAVLSPENCLRDGFPHPRRHLISPPRSKPRRSSPTHIANPAQSRSGSRRQPRSPAGSLPPSPPQSNSNNDGKAYRAKIPGFAGQVRILKRGEELTPTKQPIAATTPVKDQKAKREDSVDHVNSDSAPTLNPLLSGLYAGSAFFISPPPSSLPLPAFCKKAIGTGAGGLTKPSAEEAAVDLRRILRLE